MSGDDIADFVLAAWDANKPLGGIPAAIGTLPYSRDTYDGMTFYRFEDGSGIGTRGRGSAHQVWKLAPLRERDGT